MEWNHLDQRFAINISNINLLPKSFGPGPIILVISQIIQVLIKKSEKPLKLLKLLQFSRRYANNYNSFMKKVRLKAKDKGRYLFKEIEISTKFTQINEFLNDLCRKLKSCSQMLTSLAAPQQQQTNDNRFIHFKCCIFCTINYFSINTLQENLQQAKSLSKLTTQPNNSNAKKLNQSFSVNRAQNKIPSQLVAINDNPNHSPIKTRLNVRETLLQQEELERIQQLKAQETKQNIEIIEHSKNERRNKLTKTVTKQQNINEPVVKKSRKSRANSPISSHSLSDSINNNLTAATSSLDSNIQNGESSCCNETPANPIYWQTNHVCKYLADNKFEMHLIYLIKEHVS